MMAHNDYARAMRGILATLPPQDADVSATVAAWTDALGVGPSRDWDESDIHLTSEMMDEMDESDIVDYWGDSTHMLPEGTDMDNATYTEMYLAD